jgi:hypothetical protein
VTGDLELPATAVLLRDDVAYEWEGEGRTIKNLLFWHDCPHPEHAGLRPGWRPTGLGAHTLVQVDPLTITASVYTPFCCGLHGFITDGVWRDA